MKKFCPVGMALSTELAEELQSLLLKLGRSGIVVVVEGKKDKAALERVGIPASHIVALDRRPLFEVAEAVAADYKEAAILTDLDAEGKKLYGTLNSSLQHLGVRVDNSLRNFLFKKTKISQIEGLSL